MPIIRGQQHCILSCDHNARPPFQLKLHDGSFTTNKSIIHQAFIDYFLIFFLPRLFRILIHFFNIINPSITNVKNCILQELPNDAEIMEDIKKLNSDSAPGWDGFTGHFFISCWDIIRGDFVAAVRDLFKGVHIPKSVASTILVILIIPQASVNSGPSIYVIL